MMAFSNPDFRKAYNKQKEGGDYITGYGVLITLISKPNTSIDVNATGVGKESEFLVLKGRYKVKIEVLLPYEEQIQSLDIDKEILKVRSIEKLTGSSIFSYILKNKGYDLTDRSKEHIFLLFEKSIRRLDNLYRYRLEKVNKYMSKDITHEFSVQIPFYVLYIFKYFTEEDQYKTQDIFNQILEDINNDIEDEFADIEEYEGDIVIQTMDESVHNLYNEGIISDEYEYQRYRDIINQYSKQALNKIFNDKYVTDDINKLKGKAQQDAIAALTRKTINLLKN